MERQQLKSKSSSVFWRLMPYLLPYWRTIALGLLCLLFSIPAANFHPLVWGYIVDHVILKHNFKMLIPAVILMFSVQLVGTILEAFRSNLLEKVGQRLIFRLRNEVYQKLQRQSISYLHDNRIGDLISRAMGDVDVLQNVAVQGSDSIISNFFTFIFISFILIRMNWKLGLVALFPIGLVFLLTKQFSIRVKKLYRSARDKLGVVNARLQENLSGMLVIKGFAQEPYETQRFKDVTEDYLQTNFRAINARSIFFPSVRVVGFVSNVLSLAYGSYLVMIGQFTLGGLVTYRGYWAPLFFPISQLAQINEMLQRAQAAGSRVFELLDQEELIQDAPDAKPLQLTRGKVEFRHVTFSYGVKPALQDVSFITEPGQMVALVGPSGAGKTTVLNLLPRFYDPQEGEVLIDDQNVRCVTQASLLSHYAIVQQETFLFNGTVVENIRYGRPDASFEEVEEAARAANAADFIREMPNGYDTEIGERGVKLSGGQKQRLSIARAFLANPKILILDEPTSSVEPESEWIIIQALERLMKGRTTFVTSHRFSLVRGADKIIVFEQGRIVEEGTHKQLMAAKGLYSTMYRQQMAG
jgi:ABC-type multidrug transport system fused ATPase/permease subunit